MEAISSGQSLLDHALTYARRGWPIFPLKPRTKIPLTVRGFKDASTDEATIRAWWQRWPDANIGLPTGEPSGTAVVDIDPRHGGSESFNQLIERHGELPDTLVCQTGGGGRHIYFNFVQGFRNSAGQIAIGIDTRGAGGYVVLPPSIHESGKEYVWEDSDDIAPADLPDWLNPSKTKTIAPALSSSNLNFTAGPVKATGEPVNPGGRNVAAASLAGQHIRAGDSMIDVLAKVRAWNASNPQPLPDAEIERTVASVARTHVSNNPGAEIRVSDPPPVAIISERKPLAKFPVELLEPPGFVGQLTKWINETAIKPQPVLALGNALAFFGAVIGRKVRTPTDLRSNLYVLGVGESGCGKDHSRKCIKKICEASGLTAEILGGEEVSSDSAILSAVHSNPAILFQFDEIGHFLANANSKYAAAHQKNIAPTFTKLFSSANTTYIGKEYSGNRDREDIIQPCACLYGTTVPSRLYEGLTPGEISDGFLGRMIVMQSDDPDPIERDVVTVTPVPESVISLVQAWHQRQDLPRAEGNLASILTHIPITVQFEPEADAVFAKFKNLCRDRKIENRGQGGLDVLWTRAREHAMKVALIIACGCEFQTPIVSGQVAEWAVQFVEHLVTTLVETVRDSVAGSEYERDLLYVLRVIREAGPKGISRTQLVTRTRKLRAQQRNDILSQLLDMNNISKRQEERASGPSATVYFAIEQLL